MACFPGGTSSRGNEYGNEGDAVVPLPFLGAAVAAS